MKPCTNEEGHCWERMGFTERRHLCCYCLQWRPDRGSVDEDEGP